MNSRVKFETTLKLLLGVTMIMNLFVLFTMTKFDNPLGFLIVTGAVTSYFLVMINSRYFVYSDIIFLSLYIYVSHISGILGETLSKSIVYSIVFIINIYTFLWKKKEDKIIRYIRETHRLRNDLFTRRYLVSLFFILYIICVSLYIPYLQHKAVLFSYLDGVSLATCVIANFLHFTESRSKWIAWLIQDAVCLYIWYHTHNRFILLLYLFFTALAILGIIESYYLIDKKNKRSIFEFKLITFLFKKKK